MVAVAFTVFYCEPDDGPSRLPEYLPFMRAGRDVLAKTNPGAPYIVLTDKRTEERIGREFHCLPAAPEGQPLMLKFVGAQLSFMFTWARDYEIVVLAGADCIANRDLSTSIPRGHSFAATYKTKSLKINNIGYSRDHDLTAWFLARALGILEGWDLAKQTWLGDQESWQAALGAWDPMNVEPNAAVVRTARPDGKLIHLYPHKTHNAWPLKGGKIKDGLRDAYLVHFKGDRKRHLESYLKDHLLRR